MIGDLLVAAMISTDSDCVLLRGFLLVVQNSTRVGINVKLVISTNSGPGRRQELRRLATAAVTLPNLPPITRVKVVEVLKAVSSIAIAWV